MKTGLLLFLIILNNLLVLTGFATSPTVDSALNSNNYISTKRILQNVVAKPRPKAKAASLEWTRALLALVSLERLIGDEREARLHFARCTVDCANMLSTDEWSALKHWGCSSSKSAPLACKIKKKL